MEKKMKPAPAEPEAGVTGRRELFRGRHLIFSEIEYRDDSGRNRRWESVDRTGEGGAVYILARIIPDDEIVLVRQFRPPAGRPMIEFPAGLVEPGEPPINISSSSTPLDSSGQRLKSAVEKPVVVSIEETWKAEFRKASPQPEYRLRMFTVIMPQETTATAR